MGELTMNDQQAEWEAMKARIRDHQDRQQLEREMLQRDRILRIVRDGLITASITGAILATILIVLVVIGYA
jgi:hypothetical protein